jgi:hypothetical protein
VNLGDINSDYKFVDLTCPHPAGEAAGTDYGCLLTCADLAAGLDSMFLRGLESHDG